MALVLEISMSLDGFVAGPNPSLDDPLGRNGEELHEWAFAASAWREAHGLEGGESNADSDVIDEQLRRTGATIMGRKMFSGGEGPWADDPNANGWWGDEPPFGHHVFVLTHHARDPLSLGDDDLPLRHRRHRVGARAGAGRGRREGRRRRRRREAAQQYLDAGLLDEMQIHVAPVLLGGGDAALRRRLGEHRARADDRLAGDHAPALPGREADAGRHGAPPVAGPNLERARARGRRAAVDRGPV